MRTRTRVRRFVRRLRARGVFRQLSHAITIAAGTFAGAWVAAGQPFGRAALIAIVPGVLRVLLSQVFPSYVKLR